MFSFTFSNPRSLSAFPLRSLLKTESTRSLGFVRPHTSPCSPVSCVHSHFFKDTADWSVRGLAHQKLYCIQKASKFSTSNYVCDRFHVVITHLTEMLTWASSTNQVLTHLKQCLQGLARAYLYVFVNEPGGLLPVIHRFHGRVRHANQIAACKHPGLAGLHRFWVHFGETPFVKFDGAQGFFHWKQKKRWKTKDNE